MHSLHNHGKRSYLNSYKLSPEKKGLSPFFSKPISFEIQIQNEKFHLFIKVGVEKIHLYFMFGQIQHRAKVGQE